MNLKDAFTLKVSLKNFYKYLNAALKSSHIFFNFLQDYTHFQLPNLEIKLPEHDSEHSVNTAVTFVDLPRVAARRS